MPKLLIIFWSQAVFEKCFNELDDTQKLVVSGVGNLSAEMNGWFFHTFTAPCGALIRCDAHENGENWIVHVRLAELTEVAPKFPEIIKSSQNEKFADFRQLKSQFRVSH